MKQLSKNLKRVQSNRNELN